MILCMHFTYYRLLFWDDMTEVYDVSMSCIKAYASRCISSHVSVQQVEPQSIMAHAAEVCTFDLQKMSRKLENVKVSYYC